MRFSMTPSGIPLEVDDDSNILVARPPWIGKQSWKFRFETHESAADALYLLASGKADIGDYESKQVEE